MLAGRGGDCLMHIKSGTCLPERQCAPSTDKERAMNDASQDEMPDEPVPAMQQVLDNPFLLLFLGVVVPTVFYVVWGVMEIVSLPIAN
jgi:hypothetical protein